MKLKNKHERYILLWCSPGFGLVDMWLPIVRKLKEDGFTRVDFVFPEPSSLRLESENSDLFNISEQFVDKVIYRGYSGRWFVSDTLIDARTQIVFDHFDEKLMRLSNRLEKGKASKYFFLKIIGKYLSIISKYITGLKEDFSQQSLYNFSVNSNVDGILFDVTAEKKPVNRELNFFFKDTPKFSIRHGPDTTWVTAGFICEKAADIRRDLTLYSVSHLERDVYKKCYGVLEENIVHAGVPRHDIDWIEFVYAQSNQNKKKDFDPFVFLIARPASPYNTKERKLKALRDIYNIICVEHKLKLIIKTHPKECIDGIDGEIYNKALGIANYGVTWMYSDQHPFSLGRSALFCVSFFSGVSVDMLAINKPTIEYLDLSGLPAYDNSESLRDKSGSPVFSYRYSNLVLGVSSEFEFRQYVESILNEYEDTVAPLRLKYKDYFSPFDGSSKMVSNDIYSRIDNS
jgi:hypothetical protein